MPYIDSHAHLTGDNYSDHDIALMRERAHKAGVEKVINICTEKRFLERAFALHLPYNVAAVPPHDVHQTGLDDYFAYIEANIDRLVAVGETGLDLVNAEGALETQIIWFKRHIALAVKYNKPLVIHCREAFAPFFAVLDEVGYQGPLLLHCFTGTMLEAEELVRRGFYISFSGILTFKKSEALRLVAKSVPLENILIETDAPWLAPEAHRGKINEPAYVTYVAETISFLKERDVRETLLKNTLSFFRL